MSVELQLKENRMKKILICFRDFAFKKKDPVLPTVYAENCKEPYEIKSYIFYAINEQVRDFA